MGKKKTTTKESSVIQKFVKSDGKLLLPVLVLVSMALLVNSGVMSLWNLIITFALLLVVFGLNRFLAKHLDKKHDKDMKEVAIIGYHVVFAVFVLFVVTPTSPYVFLGLILVFMSQMWFGRRGALLSLLAQLSVLSFSYLLNVSEPSYQEFAALLAVMAVIIILTVYLKDATGVANQKISELSTVSEDAKTEHQTINSLINSMGDGVIVTDRAGKIENYNGAALQLLDTNDSIGGKSLSNYMKLTDKDGKEVDPIVDAQKHRRTINRDDLVLSLSKEDKLNLYLNISPILVGYGEGSEKGYTLILRDITSQKSLEEERDEFISVVSHELRTPIAITEGKISNSMLMNKNLTKDKKIGKSLKEAHEQTLFLAAMINDLATLARAERGKLDMEISLIDPCELLKEVESNYTAEAKVRKLKLTVKAPKNLPKINNSKLYVEEILQNFVTNAIKYTQKGTIAIEAKHGEEKGTVAFSVKDSGIGVSTSDQKHLFEKFFRSEDYRTRESSGTGLGLHVTKKLADKVGGKLEMKSKLNSGSTFTLTVGSIKK